MSGRIVKFIWDHIIANVIAYIAKAVVVVITNPAVTVRFLLPLLILCAGYLYYKSRPPSAYSSPEEEAAWNDVLGHGKWKSYDEKIAAMKKEREEREKAKAASAGTHEETRSTVQKTPSPFDPATAPKMTMMFDMFISYKEERVYLRENPNSMKADFLVICAPHEINAIPFTPAHQKELHFYNKILDDLNKDLSTLHGWVYRAVRQRRWVVVFADPYGRISPSPLYDSVGAPPVGYQVCDKQLGEDFWVTFHRHYFKIDSAP
jgi:hypothetical protein